MGSEWCPQPMALLQYLMPGHVAGWTGSVLWQIPLALLAGYVLAAAAHAAARRVARRRR